MHGEEKHVLRLIQELYCLKKLVQVWALILDLNQRQPISHFSWRVTCQGDFCHLEEAANLILSWDKLIQVDTELILDCFAPAPSKWWVLALALYTCYNYQRQSHIISSKHSTACTVGPFYWTLELGAEWQTHYAWTPQRTHDLSCQPLTLQFRFYNSFRKA